MKHIAQVRNSLLIGLIAVVAARAQQPPHHRSCRHRLRDIGT
jgi:hypothetical protein